MVTYSVFCGFARGFQRLRTRFCVVLYMVFRGLHSRVGLFAHGFQWFILTNRIVRTRFSMVYTLKSFCLYVVFNCLYLEIELFRHWFHGFYAGTVYWPGHSPGHCQAPLALHCVGACLPAAHVYPRGASDDARWGPLWGRDGLLHAHMQASGRPQSAAPKQSTAQEQVPTQQQPRFRQATRPGSETLNTIFFSFLL